MIALTQSEMPAGPQLLWFGLAQADRLGSEPGAATAMAQGDLWMKDMPRFSGYDERPIYTMKTVVQQTGITPTTLRAWERRYGILRPDRTDGGYRLYSEQDIALLRWLKSQIEAGINIGRAVALLELKRAGGRSDFLPVTPEADSAARFRASAEPDVDTLFPDTYHTKAITEELLHALLAFCETKAGSILSEAFALHSYEIVTEHIIVPALVEAGERSQRGAATVVQANFVINFLRQKISSMLAAYSQPASGPLAIAGSAPGEWHDIGILLVALALRRQGWRGPVSRPECACFAANRRATAIETRTGMPVGDYGRERDQAVAGC